MQRTTDSAGQRLFSIEEYYRMAEAGIFGPDDRLELIRGVVREMSPPNRRHVISTTIVRERFARGLVGRASVYEEKPLRLAALQSEPQPDVAVYSNPDVSAFGTEATETLLVVEVADSSLSYDLGAKAALYAEGGIPEYWVVDVEKRRLVVFREPRQGTYRLRTTYEPGTRVTPLAWPDLEVDVGSLFAY